MKVSFTIDETTEAKIRAFAECEKRKPGNLALVAIEEYMRRRLRDQERAELRRQRRAEEKHVREADSAARLVAASAEGISDGSRAERIPSSESEVAKGGSDA